jgi:hypothetical protein
VTNLETFGLDQDSSNVHMHIVEKELRERTVSRGWFVILLMLAKNGNAWELRSDPS